jgi:chorismate mutase / prephenate dehydratase
MSDSKPAPTIAGHRDAIDAIDRELTRLVNERAGHAQAIGRLKQGGAAYRPEREMQVLGNVAAANRGPLADAALQNVFVEVMSACRGLEEAIRVSYLGPVGTFSEMAVTQHFGAAVEAQTAATIDAAVRAAETGATHYAVVPVENSTEGAIGRTLDLMLQTPLKICGEVVVRVHQNLMASSTDLAAIRKVYSHQQSLAQTHGWLSHNLPHAERVAVVSNAEAARMAAAEPGTAAIGPAVAARHYGLTILSANIEDDSRNRTRFLVLGKTDCPPTGNDRTSVVLSAHNKPGAVHALLAPLAENAVSMSRIESRPARTGQWEYFFYIDLQGHREDPHVARALAMLATEAPFVKIFGSYPAARV